MEPADAGAAGCSQAVPDEAVSTGSISTRVIVHVDLDCFYAQVEMISNPELKNKPLGVQQKSLVITCNYEARKLGVRKCMKVRDAKEKCPQLVLINGEDLTRYREMSYKVTELLGEFTPLVERLGFDENFVDITEMVEKRLQELGSDEIAAMTMSGHVYSNKPVNLHDTSHVKLLIGSQIAAEMREAMYNQLGLTGCAGIAPNKLLAKLVSGVFKPNQQTVLLPESCQDLILHLNHVKEIPGIGYKTARCLEALGIHSVHDLQTFPSKILENKLGISVAQHIQKLSFGEDNSSVIPSGPPQSFSEEDSFKNCSSEVEAKKKIKELLAILLNRICQDGRKPHTVRLAIRRSSSKYCSRESRQCPIPAHVIQKLGTGNCDVMTPLISILMKLFRNMVNVKMPFHLTLLSVCFCNLKALNIVKKGPMDCYLTSSLLATSHSGKHRFEMKDMEDFSKVKEAPCDIPTVGTIESVRTEVSSGDSLKFSREKDTNEFPHYLLPEDVDEEVFKQLPADIQKEIVSEKSKEKCQVNEKLSGPLHASQGILSFFTKQSQDNPLNPTDNSSNCKQVFPVSRCEAGTLGSNSSSSYLASPNEGLCFSSANPAFLSFPNFKSKQLFSKNHPIDSHKQIPAASHQGLTESREQDSAEKKISFPPDIDLQVFYELPEEVQKELLAEWKRTG